MKAIVYERYGSPDVLELKDVDKPVPKENEVLIKIEAALATTGDCEMRSAYMPNLIWVIVRIVFGLFRPKKKILGAYLAGVIKDAGKDVRKFTVGQNVFACTGMKFSAYAEYICLPEDGAIAQMPKNMSFEEASTVPMGIDAVHFMRLAEVREGETVLINGAGGSIGTVAVQLAKYLGAEVTVVDTDQKLQMLLSIGADHMIDYKKDDFTKSGMSYDVIFDLVIDSSYTGILNSLNPDGRYIMANPAGILPMLRGIWTSLRGSKKVISKFASPRAEDLDYLREIIEEGKLKAVIDKTYPLEQAANAHRYIESGLKKGNVVLSVA